MAGWLLLTYKLPSEPSRRRVYVWRKLKRLGAINVYEAVWVLPENFRTREQFQWLAVEIQEMGGEALVWAGKPEFAGQEEAVRSLFTRQVDEAYRQLLARMDQPDLDAPAAAAEYLQIKQRDFFNSELGNAVLQKLLAVRGGEA